MSTSSPKFTVDTHLFRELGELLVGRDSTALVELIKNSYDADASVVTVTGERLDDPAKGRIVIQDDGIGMTEDVFNKGFLRIASRIKEGGDRRSPKYKRRFTGAKGVGRLAAHKLARHMLVDSSPDQDIYGSRARAVLGTIDWVQIESAETLDKVPDRAVKLDEGTRDEPGTTITLTNLRNGWTPSERLRVIREVSTFSPPAVLLDIPARVPIKPLLLKDLTVRDVARKSSDPGFEVKLLGDLDVGEDYWAAIAETADWILEIEADRFSQAVRYRVTPTEACRRRLPDVQQHRLTWNQKSFEKPISFQSRILIREGNEGNKKSHRPWLAENSGVRLFMEGFRVLPYAESGDDWLELDYDVARRSRSLRYLEDADLSLNNLDDDDDAGLGALKNSSYFGAVFLTTRGAPALQMLVNREGFIPNAAFDALRNIVRVGIDYSVRIRAFEKRQQRVDRRQERKEKAAIEVAESKSRLKVREAAEAAAEKAVALAKQARGAVAAGDHDHAEKLIATAAKTIAEGASFADELVTDRSIMQILAGIGLQMSSFVHEMNSLLGMTATVEKSIAALREEIEDRKTRMELAKVLQSVTDLRHVVERQASYLTDITSPDSRRRRSRQKFAERLDAAVRIVKRAIEKQSVSFENAIPQDLRSPPMFPAELTVVYSNLLTNAIKACQRNGRIRATGRAKPDGSVVIKLENTGRRVKLSDADKWFLPFKSTTIEADPILGQGMGMGLPIARNILEEYGATIRFVEPSNAFATAIEINFA